MFCLLWDVWRRLESSPGGSPRQNPLLRSRSDPRMSCIVGCECAAATLRTPRKCLIGGVNGTTPQAGPVNVPDLRSSEDRHCRTVSRHRHRQSGYRIRPRPSKAGRIYATGWAPDLSPTVDRRCSPRGGVEKPYCTERVIPAEAAHNQLIQLTICAALQFSSRQPSAAGVSNNFSNSIAAGRDHSGRDSLTN